MVARLEMPGIQIAFWRQFIGFGVYGLVFLLIGRRLTWRTVRLVVPAGVLLGLEIGVFFTALRTTTIANATIIGALQPILLLAVASRRYRETVTGWLFGASAVAIGGVVLVMWGASSEAVWSPRGDLLALLAMVLFSAYFVVVKDIRASVDTFTLQTVAMIIGAVTVLPIAAIEAGTPVLPVPSGRQFAWLLVLLAVPGTGHYLMNWAHLHVSLSVAGLLTLAIPVGPGPRGGGGPRCACRGGATRRPDGLQRGDLNSAWPLTVIYVERPTPAIHSEIGGRHERRRHLERDPKHPDGRPSRHP
jgi:drug/metabolite transporter (DMT)-like permease